MSLRLKLILICLAAVVTTVAAGIFIQISVIREQGVDLTRDAMRGVLLSAENMRAYVSKMQGSHVFSSDLLAELKIHGSAYRESKLYTTVPVVAAWHAIENVASKEGYTFHIAARSPRNADNQPRPEDEEILKSLEQSGQTEYFSVDHKRNEIVYSRPVRLSRDCLGCHGDPGTSPTQDGKDVLGFRMENWTEGQIHGAFILRASTDRLTPVIRAGIEKTLLATLPVAVLVSFCLFLFVRTLSQRLHAIGEELNESAATVTSAVGQIASAAGSLARDASDNSAAVDQTSVSSNRINALAVQNSNRSASAADLVIQSQLKFDAADVHLQTLIHTMAGINSSAEKISAITKAVEQIALQTNILALNAAVEAARAGEAGLGFAVVADEVRSLAQKSSGAVSETNALIADAISRSHEGKLRVDDVALAIRAIAADSHDIKKLVDLVRSGSQEQVEGIEAIGGALQRMSSSTQSTAASAEETSAIAEQLNSQAQSLNAVVTGLVDFIDGSDGAR